MRVQWKGPPGRGKSGCRDPRREAPPISKGHRGRQCQVGPAGAGITATTLGLTSVPSGAGDVGQWRALLDCGFLMHLLIFDGTPGAKSPSSSEPQPQAKGTVNHV